MKEDSAETASDTLLLAVARPLDQAQGPQRVCYLLRAGFPVGYVRNDKKKASSRERWMGRHLAAAVVIMMAVAGIGDARAQDYPTRTATVIVPFAAGGPADITGRIVADIFSRYLGQKFVVENAIGAGGTTGAIRAARAPADGYTILSGHLGTNALAPAFYPNLAYDPQKDFEPIGLTAEYPELLVVRKDFPANNLREFVAYAKANPEKLNVGHAGLGSVSYIGCMLLHSAIGIKPTMIPFTGTAPVLNAMLSGQVDYECDPVLGTLSQVQAGNVKALAVAAKKRSPLLPDVPTSYEQGLPEFDIAPFYAVFVPTGTPQAIVDKLADALSKGLNEDAVKKRLAELGAESVEQDRRGPKALTDLIKAESARLLPILKAAAEKEK
ncbi:MAG TPA: tripartite tricarboxylate transporter substrate-binding protein [Bradyrhizobium sp.]|nr:tripartite tricarboxylate transporter substrate-binding protein [Bradyrhizobium sp.]